MIKKIPLSSSGLIFSLSILGSLFERFNMRIGLGFTIGAIVLYLIFATRLFLTREDLNIELSHPNAMAFFSCFTMSSMLIGANIYDMVPRIGYYLWFFGLISQGLIIITFIMRYLININIKNIYPSCFLLFCGMATATITALSFGSVLIAQRCFYFAGICYLVLSPVLFYRIFVQNDFEDELMPTITLSAFPSSILLIGYIVAFEYKNIYILVALLILSGATYIFSLSQAPSIFKSNSKFVTSITVTASFFAYSAKVANEYLVSVEFTYDLAYVVYISILLAFVALIISFIKIGQCTKYRMLASQKNHYK